MLRDMAVRHNVAGIWHRHMAEQEYRRHVGRIGEVIGPDQSLGVCQFVGTSRPDSGACVGRIHGHAWNIVAQNRPTVANQVLLQPCQLHRQIRAESVVHQQNDFSSRLDQRRLDAGKDIAFTIISRSGFADAILVIAAHHDLRVRITDCRGSERSDAGAPCVGTESFAINGVAGGARVGRPNQQDLRRIRLCDDADLHGVIGNRLGPTGESHAPHSRVNQDQTCCPPTCHV